MAFIAPTEATTVGEVVDYCTKLLLNGLYSDRAAFSSKGEVENQAARHAIQQLADLLNEVYCADKDTLLKDVATPVL